MSTRTFSCPRRNSHLVRLLSWTAATAWLCVSPLPPSARAEPPASAPTAAPAAAPTTGPVTPGPDLKANADRGRTLAFDQARWDDALPLLAAGDDPALQKLAAGDVAAADPSASAIARVVAGHDWWDWAATRQGRDRVRGQERAAYWYRLALPAVADEPRRGELLKLVAAADADAEAFYAKLPDTPRPSDPGRARLDRAALTDAESVPLDAVTVDKDTAISPRPDGKPYRIEKQLDVTAKDMITLTFEAGAEVRGGTIDLRQRGHLVAKGTPERPVVFRKVVFLQDLGASLTATHAVFDECQFNKGGAWFTYHSSKWTFDDCLLYRSAFGRLTGVDYGFRLRRCALASMTLPEIAHNRDKGKAFDHMAALRGEWNQIDACDFLDCTVPPTVAWCARKSNFIGCRFAAGEAFQSPKDAEVVAYVEATAGDAPERAWAANPPAGDGRVRLSPAAQPFETTQFAPALGGHSRPVPEVAVHKGRARVIVPRETGR